MARVQGARGWIRDSGGGGGSSGWLVDDCAGRRGMKKERDV